MTGKGDRQPETYVKEQNELDNIMILNTEMGCKPSIVDSAQILIPRNEFLPGGRVHDLRYGT